MVSEILSVENPVFRSYLFYCAVLCCKMLLMSLLTGRQRFAKKVFASPEDVTILSKSKIKYDDPDVERVRRAHLNDLENIPLFFMAAFAYMLTNPSPLVAMNLFRLFTIARIVHTFVYAVVVIPQPARALSFAVGVMCTSFMALTCVFRFLSAL